MTQALCQVDEFGAVSACFELAEGVMAWGPAAGTWQDGLSLVLTAYFAGFLVAAIRHTLMNK